VDVPEQWAGNIRTHWKHNNDKLNPSLGANCALEIIKFRGIRRAVTHLWAPVTRHHLKSHEEKNNKIKLSLRLNNSTLCHESLKGSGCMDLSFLDRILPGTHWIGGRKDPRAGLDRMQKWKFLTLPGLELQPLFHLARSQLLYWLRYHGTLSHLSLLRYLPPYYPAVTSILILTFQLCFRLPSEIQQSLNR
jgi:hypothetical protein